MLIAVAVGLAVLPAVAAARTQVVYAGGQPAFQEKLGKRYSYGEALSYFPDAVTIHVGDTIAWEGMSINFHTIDLPGAGGKALPLITPTGSLVAAVSDPGGSPFWFSQKAAQLGFNPALAEPSGGSTYSGSARVDSGLPFGPPGPFKVTFTKAGHYAYFCDVHPGMHGLVVVVPKSKPAPSAARNAATASHEQAAATAAASVLARAKVHGNRVSLGMKGAHNVEVLRMFQGVTHVKVGTVVTFEMAAGSFETHTAAFGQAAYLKTLSEGFDKSPIDARSIYRSSPPHTGPILLEPGSHGGGFANTGALQRFKGATLPRLDKIKFTHKGTYNFQCLVHPFMRGVIVVK